jgi:predicted ATPase
VWPGAIVEENTLAVHISAIRKALGADRAMLKTHFGRGYRLLGRWTPRPDDTRARPANFEWALPPAPPVQGNLPAPVSDLIGRATAVQHLLNLVSAYRVVTLTGAGGIGKSRLALEIAHASLSGYAGDVWLVELASLSDGGLVAAAIAGVLGLDLGPNDISPEALARAIGRRRLLLVIDNCEHLVDAAATMVETLIRQCPAASVVATSREVLRIQGECAYRVLPLDVPDEHQSAGGSDKVQEASAVQLFRARMTEQQSGLGHQEDLAAVAAICRRLDGIPLAIEFAAARAAALGLRQVLSRLDDRFALLTSGRRTALPKHRTLRATLDWSYELLSVPERLLLQCLAIFVGTFSLEAAGAVVAITEGATGDAADGIENLITKSLVSTNVVGTEAHYRLLETTRAYAFNTDLRKFLDRSVFSLSGHG